MKAFLPFSWERLDPTVQGELSAARSDFICHAFLRAEMRQLAPPDALPRYLVFTSANGVRAALAQPWFNRQWRELPTFVVGFKTAEFVESQGLQVRARIAPPASEIIPLLPASSGSGLWISGEDTAHDLVALAPAGMLERKIGYWVQRDTESLDALQKDLEKYKIRSICVPSERVVHELRQLMPLERATAPQLAVVLSKRLATIAAAAWPHIQVHVVQDLESGVRVLHQDLYAQ